MMSAGGRGGRQRNQHRRRHSSTGGPDSPAALLIRGGGAAVRVLHAWFYHIGQCAAAEEPGPDGGGDSLVAGGQSLPLHRLRSDRARGAEGSRGNAREAMTTDTKYRVIGTRPVRPDGVDKV